MTANEEAREIMEQVEEDNGMAENERVSDSLKALVGHPVKLTTEEQLEWLWGNCRIIYQDVCGNYHIEHYQWAKKDSRAFIEEQMPNVTGEPSREKA